MNMLGKILVMLIFIMSIFFMVGSFMVYMSQSAWKAKATQAEDTLRTQRDANAQLENSIRSLQIERAAANAARTNAIALLEANLAASQTQLSKARADFVSLQAQQQQQGKQVTGSLQTLQAERSKVDALRKTVNAAQAERDKMFSEVVDLKNQNLELEAVRQRLSASQAELLDRIANYSAILRANDLKENEDISGIPPKRDGRIRKVGPNNKLVVVSLGEDDGLKRGHTLYVHRGEKYLGRIQLTKTLADQSVARVVDGTQKAAIMRGDSVRTK